MSRERKKRFWRAAVVLAGALLAGLAVYLLSPPCLILQTTGFYCAGCGFQRLLAALFRGDIPGAFRQNPFLFVLSPLAGAYVLLEASRYIQGKPFLLKSKKFLPVLAAVLLLSIVFAVLRNLPPFRFLGPV